MSREKGWTRADVDTGLFADPKVVRLARQYRDPEQTAIAVCLFTGLVLASWAAGERVTLEESLPAWYLEPVDQVLEAMQRVELLDDGGRIQAHAWESWYSEADARRENMRERWRRANETRQRGSRAATSRAPRGNSGDPDRTGPTGPIPFHPEGAKAPTLASLGGDAGARRNGAAPEADRV